MAITTTTPSARKFLAALYDLMMTYRWFRWSVSHLVYNTVNRVIDYGGYSAAIYLFGLTWGSALMAVLTFVYDQYCLRKYILHGKDWFGFDDFRKFREDVELKAWIRWLLKLGNLVVYLFLSCWYNPFVTVAYFKKLHPEEKTITGRDWWLFYSSFIIGQIFWVTTVYYLGIKTGALHLIASTLWWLWNSAVEICAALFSIFFRGGI